jgi:hypothetical protein
LSSPGECWVHVPREVDTDKLNPQAEKGVFIGYTKNPSQYLVWVPGRRQVIKATKPKFIEDQDGASEPEISELAELGGDAQQGGAQPIEIPPLNDNSSDEDSDDDMRPGSGKIQDSNSQNSEDHESHRESEVAEVTETNQSQNEESHENREPEQNTSQQQGVATRSGRAVKLTRDMQQSVETERDC